MTEDIKKEYEELKKDYKNCKLAGEYLVKKYPKSKTCEILNKYMKKGRVIPKKIDIVDIDLEEVKVKAKKELEKEVLYHVIGYINRFIN